MEERPPAAAPAENRRLAAIMFTDMVGFSRQVGADESRALHLLTDHNAIIRQAVATYQGQILRFIGDAFLVEFPSVVNAVQCAQQLQARFRAYNAGKAAPEQIHVRIGIHTGDIIHRDHDVFGEGANIAARLQEVAAPDTICLSHKVYEEVEKKIPLGPVLSLGRPRLKNIEQRFPVYALLTEPPKGLRQVLRTQRLKFSRRVSPAQLTWGVAGLGLVVGVILALHSPSFLPLITRHLSTPAQPALPLPDKPSIVVLPFDNMSGDPQQDYFSNGITEVLTSDLSRISSLFVIARNTAFTYKGKATNVHEIGKELGVRYVLEGSVQKAGEQVRIVAQLVDTTTDAHVWAERYDRPLKDLFALQDEIVQQIVTTLKLQLTLEEQGVIVRKHTNNLEAYDAFLHGQEYFYRYTKEANTQARQLYEQAIALDPQYAEAYAWLGATYWLEWSLRWSADPQNLERAGALEQQAVARDDSLPIGHSLLGNVYAWQQQYEQAIAEGERAIALDPNNADSYAFQAQALNNAGRSTEALRMIEQGMRLNPHYPPWYLWEVSFAYRFAGRYAEAIAAMQELIRRNPDFLIAHVALAGSYVEQWLSQQSPAAQTLEPAVAAVQRALALNDSLHWNYATLGSIYLYQQQYEQALAEMERAVALAPNEAWSYAALADVLSRMGRTEEALAAAAQALRLKSEIADSYLASVGSAYAVAGRYEEARAPLQRFLSRYPNFLPGHLTLAIVYNELGQAAEARAEAAEVLRLNPNFSLAVHRQRMPIKDPAVLERHLAALRKAGLK
jgi:adenylate cyclase